MPLLSNITLGRYIPGHSLLHQLDPRVKILGTAALLTALLAGGSGLVLASFLLLVGVAGKRSGFPFHLQAGNLRPLAPILVLTFALNALMTPGTVVYALPFADITHEGLVRGLFLAGRFCAVVLTTSLFTFTTSPLELADGLERLLRPFRCFGFPAHELAMTTTIALRFVPLLVDEADRLRKSQLARGADFGGGPIRRVRSLLPLLLPLFISAFGRADRLAVAMESRCYRGGLGRSQFRVLTMDTKDRFALCGFFLLSGLVASAGSF
ncbi:MAG: energy-coupling factor transporter transmembrane protein EcfT [bacterium]|nr:energy-coupling factor transporter transmembrane protein EcfT [bacterium]